MAQDSLGDTVREAIGGRYRKAYDTVRKVLGDPSKPREDPKRYQADPKDVERANASFRPAPAAAPKATAARVDPKRKAGARSSGR